MLILDGKHYRTRQGDVFGPMTWFPAGPFWKTPEAMDKQGFYWHRDGTWDGRGDDPRDLVEEVEAPSPDPINAPEHYTSHASGIQPIDIAEHMSFCLGNVVKYVMRFERKGGLEDLKKARFYIEREIARREKQP